MHTIKFIFLVYSHVQRQIIYYVNINLQVISPNVTIVHNIQIWSGFVFRFGLYAPSCYKMANNIQSGGIHPRVDYTDRHLLKGERSLILLST